MKNVAIKMFAFRLMVCALLAVGALATALQAAGPAEVKTTGGGFITLSTGGKGTFGYNAQNNDGELKGNLTYQDHDTGMMVKAIEYTAIVAAPCPPGHPMGECVWLFGVAEVTTGTGRNKVTVLRGFMVDVLDAGEPGTLDGFWITLYSNYTVDPVTGYVSGTIVYEQPGQQFDTIDGGNIQVH